MAFPLWLAAAIPQAANMAFNWFGQKKQGDINKDLAASQHAQNMELLKYQLDYNTPKNQMARFAEAGLNPNLVYGQGSAGNMESAPRYPDIKPPDFQGAMSNIGTQFQQTRLMSAQADLVTQKVEESGVKQDLMRAQTALTTANPYLNKGYVESLVLNLQSVAKIKEQQASFLTEQVWTQTGDKEVTRQSNGFTKMQLELDTLAQRFKLGQQDSKIKSEIIQSKEFQNALQEIQLKWMKDGEITPQHIYMGIMLLLQKMM